MKRYSGVFMMTLSVIISLGISKVWAEENSLKERFYFEPEAMVIVPGNDDENEELGKDELKPGPFIGSRIGFEVSPWTSLEFETGWAKIDEKFEGEEVAELTMVPLFLNVKLDLTSGEARFSPYVYVGGGVIFNDYDLDISKTIEILNDILGVDLDSLGVTVSVDVGNAGAIQAGGGLLYRLNKNWSIFAEARYLHAQMDITATVATSDTEIQAILENEKLDMFIAGAGFRFNF
ncbi:MAG: outer membrane beta-barrel protein [Chlamydiae bacterium]|nr:outer membrane beta-barrel protein [Chlamydiota bacterium]MBI3277791.1 outer membrane beta-barrel protein [Chlamydiota bacterium]